ncbi:methionyl-tRNA formyltransferase [Gemmobacter serpentinus]|uniref:methionyl-tRNA formyltransferase n=1 Tax=Gemmobacter serpentinus TaxID=2652247 RepID=UPI00124E17BE|nr:methionyl-tRNA formyltransferase [Gemmobacter serpentinus]
MARINAFTSKAIQRTSLHDEVEATFHAFERDGELFLQIDTYGREGRKLAGKVSQSIQLGKEGRKALQQILNDLAD